MKYDIIKIECIYDLVPQIIKSKRYYELFKKYKLIKYSNKNDILKQIVEVNHYLFRNIFKIKINIIDNSIIQLNNNKYRIGIHYRSNDNCLNNNKCKNSNSAFKNVMKLLKNYSIELSNNFSISLSSADKNFIRKMMKINKDIILYKNDLKIIHSYKLKNIKNDTTKYEKIIGDIILISKSNRYILSYYSTFSLLMYYLGGLNDKHNLKPSEFINEKGEIVDKNKLEIVDLINRRYLINKKRNKKCKKLKLEY